MVFVSLDRASALEAIALARTHGHFVWVGSDAISEVEHRSLCDEGVRITRFDYPLDTAEAAELEDALATVMEHHPEEILWVQHRPQSL